MKRYQQSDFSMELGVFLKPLLRWWWLILLSTLVAVSSSYYMLSQRQDYYQVQSSVILGQSLSSPSPTYYNPIAAQEWAQTYIEAAKRQPVRKAAMENLGLDWLPEYFVRPVPNTQLIEIIVNDTVPERALAVNQELLNQIILLSPSGNVDKEPERQAELERMIERLNDEIEETVELEESLAERLLEATSAREISELETEINAIHGKMAGLQYRYMDALSQSSQEAINAIRVFEEPTLPTEPLPNNFVAYILTAAAIGFVVGAAAAYFLEYLDDTVKSAEEIGQLVNLTVLASVGEMKPDNKMERVLVTYDQPRTPTAEAFRALRTSIQFSNIDEPMNNLVITSSVPGEGKSTIASNLAVVMAQSGQRTLLVDADLRKPSLHNIFGVDNRVGMTKLLVSARQREQDLLNDDGFDELLDSAAKKVTENGLMLLTSGPLPPNPAEMLGSAKMKWLIERLKKRFDVVIFDTPPCLPVTDAVVMSARTDGVLIIGREGETRKQHLRKTINNLAEVNANIVGVVLNRVSAKGLSSYYGSYYWHYGVGGEKEKRRRGLRKNKRLIENPEI